MTKKLFGLVVLVSVLAWTGSAFAACPAGYKLQVIGSMQTDDAVITTQGQDVHMIIVTCTGTACVAGLANTDTLQEQDATADYITEVGAAASGTAMLDLTDSPLFFRTGITFNDDGNVQAIGLYSCQPA